MSTDADALISTGGSTRKSPPMTKVPMAHVDEKKTSERITKAELKMTKAESEGTTEEKTETESGAARIQQQNHRA